MAVTRASPTAATPRVRLEWRRRVEAEYRSAALTQQLGLWLIQMGASPDSIRTCRRIVADELAHAELSQRTYVAAGGSEAPRIDRKTLELPRDEQQPLENDVVRACIVVFCLGETVAVPLFKELRARCTVPVARRALDRVLRDEVRHREFGWELLDWLLSSPDARARRAHAASVVPGAFAGLRAEYTATKTDRLVLLAHERAWGLMPPSDYARIFERSIARDYIPRFREIGIDLEP